jgi:hypothetical protein
MGRSRKSAPQIHTSIKTALGYDADQSDQAVLDHWKHRQTRVCKPCWELKYSLTAP